MRQIVKASNNGPEGHFSIGRGTNANPGSAASTPHKQRKNATAGLKTPTSGKRKHVVKAEEDVGGDAEVLVKEEDDGKKPLGDASAGVNQGQVFVLLKTESIDEDAFVGDGSPSKRARRASTLHPGMVNTYNEEDSGTELDSSVSEYLPEESAKVEEEFWMA
ncbi:uncharacterized protein BDW43DRAFT_276405 [Aspergillus alliaceus]|uniref:uncharacterized protein n=1 Tax=Petromyces alliaceus TaxID=209559 RepID=UPI0012A48269|nr:uncharacterized protein BDW43DRAFT_276405 [Aspergillus alliaceus]KAB8233480.1 hypothetical protein BDW43DRAFT_276405 [Aspergillus alliaceus]